MSVTLGGTASAATVTDAGGAYSFGSLAAGNYTITPALSGYGFTPSTLSVAVAGSDLASNDFTSFGASSIAGRVSGAVQAGVAVNLAGAAAASTSTDGGGNYSFGSLVPGNYAVTPTLDGFDFSPSHLDVALIGSAGLVVDVAADGQQARGDEVLEVAGRRAARLEGRHQLGGRGTRWWTSGPQGQRRRKSDCAAVHAPSRSAQSAPATAPSSRAASVEIAPEVTERFERLRSDGKLTVLPVMENPVDRGGVVFNKKPVAGI